MRVIIKFGLSDKKEVVWWRDLEAFPKLLKFSGKKWEWFMYDRANDNKNDYELTFSEIPTYDPNFYADTFEDYDVLFGTTGIKCECGAAFTSFPWDHLRMCPKHVPWSQI